MFQHLLKHLDLPSDSDISSLSDYSDLNGDYVFDIPHLDSDDEIAQITAMGDPGHVLHPPGVHVAQDDGFGVLDNSLRDVQNGLDDSQTEDDTQSDGESDDNVSTGFLGAKLLYNSFCPSVRNAF